jgi:hypothetical protein
MSKINQIQSKLRELDGGAFQKLADAYLLKKGYERINTLGSTIGFNKVKKGTPDTLVLLPNGKYVFAEHTTEQKNLYRKLEDDLKKCLDERKTRIPVNEIEEVVFCHNSTLSVEEERTLAGECQKHGINLNIFGINPISYDLYQKYPGLAREYLGVEVDTGQIVPTEEFVAAYNKNKLATRLDTSFHFREKEVDQVVQGLKDGNLVIVSGRAGVGKSRLALECCERFKEIYPKYEIRCVFNRGPDLLEDLRIHFSEPGNYLILVDDANRISQFDYVVQLLQERREYQRIKVVATVRDYALDKLRVTARPHGSETEIDLQPLEDKQIKQLIEDEYSIHHHLYLDRIADIAKGNPCLAIMAAEIAKRENSLKSISNVSAIYDVYFASIRQDLKALGKRDLIKVAGIVAFFRAVDRSNEEMMGAIQNAFGISSDAFWKTAHRLHEIEVLDMYEDEIVRSSDQVLATYLFYLAFFKERALDFSALLDHFFPRLRHRLADAINPLLNAFDSKVIMKEMCPHVDRIWKSMEEAGNKEDLIHLIDTFWLLKQTDTLLYVKGRIQEMEPKPVNLADLAFKADSDIPSPSLLSVLGSFKFADDDTFLNAVELLCDYIAKQPGELPKVFHIFTDRFGFRHTSYLKRFSVQRAVIDVLWKQARDGKNELFSKLFLAVAEQYLHTSFQTTELKGKRALTIIDFQLPATPALFELRRKIWSRLFLMYQMPALKEAVLNVLYSYSTSGYTVNVSNIVKSDSEVVIHFIESELDPNNYRHCSVVQSYLDLLEDHKVEFNNELRGQFMTETLALSELLTLDWAERRTLEMDYEEYQKYKKDKIREHFMGFSFADYERLIKQCLEIQANLEVSDKKSQFHFGVVDVLVGLADWDPDLYAKVLEHYLELSDPLRLNPFPLTKRLVEALGAERANNVLSRPEYINKRLWLFGYHISLPSDEVRAECLNQLYALYREAEVEELPDNIDFLLKYRSLEEEVVPRVTEIILEKVDDNSVHAYALSGLFNSHTDVNKAVTELFAQNLDLLKRAYVAVLKTDRHEDHNGQTFARILNLKPDFILEYIDCMYEKKERLSRYDSRDYSFLWMRDDYEELIERIADRIYEQEKERYSGTYFETLFGIKENDKDNPEIREKQYHFLKGLIERRHGDVDFMKFVFRVIANFPPDRRRQFVALFLEYNKTFEDFEDLPFDPNSWWSGSAVPMLQERVKYFESLLPFLNTVKLLQHKQYIERGIQEIRSKIEREKKGDFMED